MDRRGFFNGWILFIVVIIMSVIFAADTVYKDATAPVDVRVEDLLSRMTLAEKIGQMNMPCLYIPEMGGDITSKMESSRKLAAGGFLEGIGPLGGFFTLANTILHKGPRQQVQFFNELQRIAVEGTRLGIPLLQIEEGTHGLMCSGGTIFPEGLTLGSTWNRDLIRDVYAVAASEARALGIHLLFTLVVEPNLDPRLGRNEEGYSEDPYLCSEIARAIVRGLQGEGVYAADRVIAGLCHYPGQSLPVSGLEQGDMEISERTLRSVFLPPWEAGIKESGALAVMATYPTIDGEPVHGSEKLLTKILRGELDFQGIVSSEGHGFHYGLVSKGVVETQKEAGAMALKAGVDVNIGLEEAYLNPLIENVREGKVDEWLVDRAVRRILRLKFLLGLFENPYGQIDRALEVSHTPQHQNLALQAAREGIVLLKNDNNLLPLDKNVKSIAVIGPNADQDRNLLGDYTSKVILQDIVTVLQGIRGKVSKQTKVEYVKGCDVAGTDWHEIKKAVNAARNSDVAIVVLGENERFAPGGLGTNGEHKDIANLDLTGLQEDLVRAVYESGTPTVVVLVNGRPLSIRWIAEHVPAIVEAWLPGEKGGTAVADILFGDYNPSGRLAITIPRHVGQLPCYYFYLPAKKVTIGRKGVGYVDMSPLPLWEFGYGLSYTNFEYSNLQISPAQTGPAGPIHISVDVRNTGARAGAEVVQLYLNDVISSVTTPVRLLKGFKKVELHPGEKKTVNLTLSWNDFSFINKHLERVVEPGRFDVMVGRSCEDIRVRGSFVIME